MYRTRTFKSFLNLDVQWNLVCQSLLEDPVQRILCEPMDAMLLRALRIKNFLVLEVPFIYITCCGSEDSVTNWATE